MKKLYTFVFTFFFIVASFAQTNTATANGTWDDKNTWSSKSLPKNGEEIIIPAGRTVTVDQSSSLKNVRINVMGTLRLSGLFTWLDIDNASIISVEKGGSIHSTLNIFQYIFHAGQTIYNGGIINGPTVSNAATNFTFKSFTVLPVKFASFTAKEQKGLALIKWTTAEERNAAYYEIERSVNGTEWKGIGRVAAAGNTAMLTHYEFNDTNPLNGLNYYRIKQVDADGAVTYTTVQTVRVQGAAQVNIIGYQNKVTVQFAQPVKGKVNVLIVDRGGQVVARQVLENPVGNIILNATNLRGNYFVAVSNSAGISASQQVAL